MQPSRTARFRLGHPGPPQAAFRWIRRGAGAWPRAGRVAFSSLAAVHAEQADPLITAADPELGRFTRRGFQLRQPGQRGLLHRRPAVTGDPTGTPLLRSGAGSRVQPWTAPGGAPWTPTAPTSWPALSPRPPRRRRHPGWTQRAPVFDCCSARLWKPWNQRSRRRPNGDPEGRTGLRPKICHGNVGSGRQDVVLSSSQVNSTSALKRGNIGRTP